MPRAYKISECNKTFHPLPPFHYTFALHSIMIRSGRRDTHQRRININIQIRQIRRLCWSVNLLLQRRVEGVHLLAVLVRRLQRLDERVQTVLRQLRMDVPEQLQQVTGHVVPSETGEEELVEKTSAEVRLGKFVWHVDQQGDLLWRLLNF